MALPGRAIFGGKIAMVVVIGSFLFFLVLLLLSFNFRFCCLVRYSFKVTEDIFAK